MVIATYFPMLVLPALALFGSTDGGLTWFVAMPRLKNGPEMVGKECIMSRFWIVYSNATLLLELNIMIGFSRFLFKLKPGAKWFNATLARP